MAGRADASGDRYAINAAPSGAISIEIEFLGTAFANQYDALLWMGQSASGGTAYSQSLMMVFGNPANNMEIWACDSSNARAGPAGPAGSWLTNTWHKACVTFANTTPGSAIALYADGNPTPIATGTVGAGTYNPQRIEIGNDVNSDNAVDVTSAFCVVTNRAFSAEEVAARAGMPFIEKARGAWSAWVLNDDTAAGLRDWSGNGRDLTETGTMTVTTTESRTLVTAPWAGEDLFAGHDAGATGVTGSANVTLGAITASGGAGTVRVDGTGTANIGAITASGGAGTVRVDGSGNVTLGAITTSSSVGTVRVDGAGTMTLGAVTATGSGTVVDPAGDITGAANITLGAITAAGTGNVPYVGTGGGTIGAVTAAGTGTVRVDGAGNVTIGAITAAGTGFLPTTGQAAITIGAITASGAGIVGDLPADPSKVGGDDSPPHRRVRHVVDKPDRRHILRIEREEALDAELRELYRRLTGEPATAARVAEIVAPIVPELSQTEAFAPQIARRVIERRLVDIEIALRMLEDERRELEEREDLEHIASVLAQML